MRNALSIAALGVVCLVGCSSKSPEGGTPGTESTFTLSKGGALDMAVSIKQGTPENVTINVNRDDKFTKAVKLEAKVPDNSKLKAEFNKSEVKPGDKGEVILTVTAPPDAPVGKHTIQVVGTPAEGKPTTLPVEVEVKTP